MEMRIEICELIRKNVSIWDYVEFFLPEFLLHLYYIVTQSIFSGKFIRLWKMVNSLVFIQSFVLVKLETLTRPQNVPVMCLCL